MKRLYAFSIVAISAAIALADYTGAGYYRVQNYKTSRYISVVDNKGKTDLGSTQVDLQALRTQLDFDVVCANPATVVYIQPAGSEYNIVAQGESLHQMIGYYLTLASAGTANGQQLYFAKGVESGKEKYIGDGGKIPTVDISYCVTSAKDDFRKWMIIPMTDTGANFFGVAPDFEANGKYYKSMLAGFPYSSYSEGVKSYYVAGVHEDMAYLKEIEGVVPGNTPVVVECATDAPTTNRLNVGGTANAISDNSLKGAYFCFTSVKSHFNYIEYNPETMRVLAPQADGSLAYIKDTAGEYLTKAVLAGSTAQSVFIPANSSYLSVSVDAPDLIRCVDAEEYAAAVEEVGTDATAPRAVYNLQGVLLYRNATDSEIDSLPAGLYIISGKKTLVK